MTLKEKLEQYIDPQIDAIHLEKIADNYAIEFAEWVDDVRVDRKILYDTSNIKELLEIFKKEK